MRNRHLRVVICFNDKEYKQYFTQLSASGLTKQAHGLKALLGKEIKPRNCSHHAELLSSLSNISNDTGHVLRKLCANGQLTEDEISLLKGRLDDCWSLIRDY